MATHLKGKNLTVQRLSSNVTRKAQNYARLGPRKFVAYPPSKDLKMEGIKEACLANFHSKSHQEVDILAGEQGPSCQTLEQIPNIKLIHIRFLDKPSSAYRNMFSLKVVEDNNDSGEDDDTLTKSAFAQPRFLKRAN